MNRHQHGFTLLEVLVALAVLALVLGAIIKAGGVSASNVALLRDRTLAGWVAENKINELLLSRDWPDAGVSDDTTTLAGREWYWEVRISETSDPDLRRLDVAIRDQKGAAPLAELIAFKGLPGNRSGAVVAPQGQQGPIQLSPGNSRNAGQR
jgi:general secretion pathway protein I